MADRNSDRFLAFCICSDWREENALRNLGVFTGRQPRVAVIGFVHGASPAQTLIVADPGQRAAEESGAGEIQAFLAVQMSFVKLPEAIVRLMRVGIEHG